MSDPLEYTTLYMPYVGPLGNQGSSLLFLEVTDWLTENVGPGTVSFQRWLLGGEAREHEWCYYGLDHSPQSDFTNVARIFHFRDPTKAMLFKLRYGGV